jgi:RNA polymerase sigma-70 factor (ECF subfamily)
MASLHRFDQVMERYSHRVYTLARYALGSAQDAEDVVQDVFTRLWENWSAIEVDRVEGWLIRVTSHACVDFRRKRSTRRRAIDSHARIRAVGGSPTIGTDPSEAVESAELQTRVGEAIARLQEPYRAVLILREIEGLSYLEIADALELSMSCVKVTLHRARAQLTEMLVPLNLEPISAAPHHREDARVL